MFDITFSSSSDEVLIDTSLSHIYTIGANKIVHFASLLHKSDMNPAPSTFANYNAVGLFSSFIDDLFSTSVNGNDCQAVNIVSGH